MRPGIYGCSALWNRGSTLGFQGQYRMPFLNEEAITSISSFC